MDRLPYWPLGTPTWVLRLGFAAATLVMAGTAVWAFVQGEWAFAAAGIAGILGAASIARLLLQRRLPLAVLLQGDVLTVTFLTSTEHHPVQALRNVRGWRRSHVQLDFGDADRTIRLTLGPGALPLRRRLIELRPELDEVWPIRRFRLARTQTALIIVAGSMMPLGLLLSLVGGLLIALTELVP